LTLVEAYGHEPLPVRELAQRNGVPERYLEHILLDLKAKGLIKSLPGRHGGYALAKSPAEITMGQVVRHFDGLLAPIACVSTTRYRRCDREEFCSFRRVLLEVRNDVARVMDNATLAKVYARKPVLNEEVFTEAWAAGAGI
ncbi:MAG: Rrf2 family transcriptional regulator, partial [Dehalococcoidia bacterium]